MHSRSVLYPPQHAKESADDHRVGGEKDVLALDADPFFPNGVGYPPKASKEWADCLKMRTTDTQQRTKEEFVSAKKPKRNTQTPAAVHESAFVALQERCTEQEQSLQHMARILRGIGDALDALKARVRQALSLSRKLPEYLRVEDLPDGCPGWGNYSTDLMTCGLCPWNLDCMTAEDERNEPSRDHQIAAEMVQKYFRQ